jgi:hypothetical protein
MSRRVLTSPRLPAPMRGGVFSAGVEAPAGRTVYVSGQVSVYLKSDKQTACLPGQPDPRRRDHARSARVRPSGARELPTGGAEPPRTIIDRGAGGARRPW